MEFVEKDPTLENYWRAIILFGANTASYKFALAHALYDVADVNNDLITLDDLALPFASHICRPIHDSFIVKKQQRDVLETIMAKAYKLLGFKSLPMVTDD